jgi:hypothetical protein
MENTDNKTPCNCPRVECERHGDCNACRENHKAREYAPFCERPQEEQEAVHVQ